MIIPVFSLVHNTLNKSSIYVINFILLSNTLGVKTSAGTNFKKQNVWFSNFAN